ncbi:hypothetical protein RB195_012751 [Necator americanus]|uniref:Uncharacterized protein n=1 Tax=Necator americanus TaxID=51031 RepID=A0ABR1DSD9_NECAM
MLCYVIYYVLLRRITPVRAFVSTHLTFLIPLGWLICSDMAISSRRHQVGLLRLKMSVQNVTQKLEASTEEMVLHRALPIRIKTMYNCEEKRVITMTPPFRGFSALVRFQCRARLHYVQTIPMASVHGCSEKETMDIPVL